MSALGALPPVGGAGDPADAHDHAHGELPRDGSGRTDRIGYAAFVVHLAVCTGLLAVVMGAQTTSTRELLVSVIAIATPFVTIAGVRWYRPLHAWAWLLVIAAEVMWIVAIGIDPGATMQVPGIPTTVNELASVAGYVCAAWAVVGLGRRSDPGRRTVSMVDAGVLGVAVTAVVWAVYRTSPAIAPHRSLLTTIGYPVMDIVIAVAVIRFAARTSVLQPAYLLGLAGAVLILVTDLVMLREPVGSPRTATLTLQFLNFAVLGLAPLHPSMGSITSAQIGWLGDIGHLRVTVLGFGLVTPPALMVLYGSHIDHVTGLGLALACAASLGLVLLRLSGMVGVIDEQGTRLGSVARSDHLTGLPNRRTVDAELERGIDDAANLDEPLVVGLLDLDHFKAYNDARGHGAGDRLLATVGSSWRAALPPDVFLGRYGGEEFAVVVRGRELDDVARLVERLRRAMEPGTSVSAGLAVWDGLESGTVLIGRADMALYSAKEAGRDAVHAQVVPGLAPRRVPS